MSSRTPARHLRKPLLLSLAGVALLTLALLPARAATPTHIKIGIVGSIFHDLPDSIIALMNKPFNAMMYAQTGMTADLIKVRDHNELGQMLQDRKVQLGIFHGIEFAWARTKFPGHKPLMIAINEHTYLKGNLVARADAPITGFADLKGLQLGVPRCTKPHCLLFMDKCFCQDCSCCPKDHVAGIVRQGSLEEGMDDVVDGAVQACVIDSVALEVYKKRKPGRFAKLKVVAKSERFPAGVIAHAPGALDDAALERFQVGMKDANKTVIGKQMLQLWKLSGFEYIPEDYDQVLTEIVKCYPAPEEK